MKYGHGPGQGSMGLRRTLLACWAGLEVAVPAVSVSRGRLVSSMAAPRVTRYAVGVAATLTALLLLHSAGKHLQLRFR